MADLDGFLSLRLDKLTKVFKTEDEPMFELFYNDISHPQLKRIFAIMHGNLNHLLSFLNDKNASNKHYNADESRLLLELIKQIEQLQTMINKYYRDYSFELNNYYYKVLKQCKNFLSSSGGSTIPTDFPNINIIDYEPIFTFSNMTELPNREQTISVKKKYIGEGSYAVVHKYKDPYYDHHFVLKKAKNNLTSEELERFKIEYKCLKQLDSPYIVKAYYYNQKDNEYVMEFADKTLKEYISKNNNKLLFNTRKALVIQLLDAFVYIHSKGIYHRDISYNNILIKHYDDNSAWIKICDFGLVKHIDSTLTKSNTEIKGTLNDISDLKRVGFKNYEIRHEIYALAQVVYFILTGKSSNYEREKNQVLRKFMKKAMDSDKNNRFINVMEMKTELVKQVLPSMKN